MTKNKFIKCLKIIVVLGPLVFNLISCVIGFVGANDILEFEPKIAEDAQVYVDYSEHIMTNFLEFTAEMCFGPYIGIVAFNEIGSIPILAPIGDFITTAVIGVPLQEAIQTFNVLGVSLIGTLCMFLYYLMIEIVFFIPEVILLFIRWCKNLVYAFTKKGGFDA